MHRVILAAALILTACASAPPVVSYRDPAQQIYSIAVFDPSRLTGTWRQVADFTDTADCPAGAVRFAPIGPAMRIEGQLCLAGVPTPVAGSLTAAGPGRFTTTGVSDPLWVLWADTDLRTLVLGTPSGRFGLILNREATLPTDRLTAAREVLAWNGYDLARLRVK